MPLAPEIWDFGDESHQKGETGLSITGAGLGPFPGLARMYANADRTGAQDDLTVGTWGDMSLGDVEIPGTTNNVPGAVYAFVQREDLAWSTGFAFTLTAAAGQFITPATETGNAQALAGQKQAAAPEATETNTAVVLGSAKQASITPAAETDSAQVLTARKVASLPVSAETDAAVPLISGQPISPATETNAAVALGATKKAPVAAATETDSAQLLTSGELTLTAADITAIAAALAEVIVIKFPQLAKINAGAKPVYECIATGTPTTTSITTASLAAGTDDDHWMDCWCTASDGDLAGQRRRVTASTEDGGTTTLTVVPFTSALSNGDGFELF